jgi:isopenicillin-N epimerase
LIAFGRGMLEHWMLDPSVTYLNHGTVGAPPRRVLLAQQKLRDEIERQPSQFLLRELMRAGVGPPNERPRLRVAADKVARFLGASGKDLVFIDNATSGVNAVLRSLDLREGDELLVLDQSYGAIKLAAEYAARVRGAKTRTIVLPHPISGPEQVADVIESAITPQTRVAIIDHITADTALILPVAEIAARCRQRGVATLVDGAHGPGAIPLDIPALGVDWYAGNLHKWAWSPRSSGILWVSPERQASLHHTVVSWGLDQGISAEFDWPGTRDPTPHLAAPDGLAWMQELGVERVQHYNHNLAIQAGWELAGRWNSARPGPESMLGVMVTVSLPEHLGSTAEDAIALRQSLLFDGNIEVHLFAWMDRLWVRVSAQIYNDMSDVERLIREIDAR